MNDRNINIGIEATQNVVSAAAAASASLEKLSSALNQLDGKNADVGVDANTATADAKIKEFEKQLEHIGTLRPEATADFNSAKAKAEMKAYNAELDKLAARIVETTVDVDDAAARVKLKALAAETRDRKMTIEVDTDSDRATAALTRLGATVSNLRQNIPGLVSTVSLLRSGFIVLAGAGIAMATTVLAPVAAGLTEVALGAGSVVGAFGLLAGAFAPTISAFQKMKTNQNEVESAQKAVATASDQLKSAQTSLADAERSAAETVKNAQDAYKDSLDAVKTARQDLATTEQDAAQGVKDAESDLKDARATLSSSTRTFTAAQDDLNEALEEEPLNQKQAELDLAQARLRVTEATRGYSQAVRENGKNSLEARQASLDLKQAQLDLSRQQHDTNEVQKHGSEQLQAAQEAAKEASQGVADAQKGVRDATKGVTEAHKEGARQIKEAEGAVKDALKDSRDAAKDVIQAQKEGQRQIAQAQKAVADAAKELADAQKTAKNTTDGLTKSQEHLWDSIQKFRKDAGNAFAPANRQMNKFAEDILDVARKFLPSLGNEAEKQARIMRHAFDNVVSTTNKHEIESYKTVLHSFGPITNDLTHAFGDLGKALLNIWAEATPDIKDFIDFFADLMKRFKEWTESAKGQKEINQLFDNARIIFKAVWEAAADISTALRKVGEHKDTVKGVADAIKGFGEFIADAVHFIKRLVDGAGDLGQGLNKLMKASQDLGEAIHDALLGKTKEADKQIDTFKKHIGEFADKVWDAFKTVFPKSAEKVKEWWQDVKENFNDLKDFVKDFGRNLIDWVVGPWDDIYDKLLGHSIIKDLKNDTIDTFKDMKSNVGDVLHDLVDDAADKFKNLVNNAQDNWKKFKDNAGDAAKNTKEDVLDWFQDMVDGSEKKHKNMKDDSKAKFDDLHDEADKTSHDTDDQVSKHFKEMADRSSNHFKDMHDQGKESANNTHDDMLPPLGDLSDTAQKYMNALLYGMQQVNKNADLGLDEIKQFNPQQAHAAVARATGGHQPVGGPIASNHWMGGVVEGDRIAIVADQGQREYVINPSRDDNVQYLAAAAREMGFEISKNIAPGYERDDVPRFLDYGAGEGISPITLHHWAPEITGRVHAIAQRTGTVPNTYPGHGEPGGSTQDYTADFWGKGGRGSPIPKAMGFKTADLALSDYNSNPGVLYIIRQGEYWRDGHWQSNTYGDPHFDHTHISWDSPGGASAGKGAGSEGIDIGPLVDKWIPKEWEAGTGRGHGAYNLGDKDGITGSLRSAVISKLEEQAGSFGSGGFGDINLSGSGIEMMKQAAGLAHVPEDWATMKSLWYILLHENGTTPQHIVWDNPANSPDFVQPFNLMIPNQYHVTMSSPQSAKLAAGLKYIDDRYGDPDKAAAFHKAHNWYTSGGVALQDQVARVGDNGPEFFMPLHDRNAVRLFVENLGDWVDMQRERVSSTSVQRVTQTNNDINTLSSTVRSRGGDNNASVREIRRLGDRLERALERRIDAKIDNIEELAAAMIAGARADAAGPVGREIANKHTTATFKKLLDKKGR